MDSNGLRFWQAADAGAFADARDLQWDARNRLLRLDRQQAAPMLAEDSVFARAQAERPAPVSDGGGGFAWWDGTVLRAAGFGDDSVPLDLPSDDPPGIPQPTDLAFGDDDVLYVARNGAVLMIDRRGRWPAARVALAGFSAHRFAPIPGGGVWAIDRVDGQIARLTGTPLRPGHIDITARERFHPVEPNPKPPRLTRLRGARLPADVQPIGIATSAAGRVAVLGWIAGGEALIFTLDDRKLVRRFALDGLRLPYALSWVGEDEVAVMASDGAAPAAQAFVYELDTSSPSARPTGAVHRLIDPFAAKFCNRLGEVPEYLVAGASALRRLRPLSRATYARAGSAVVGPFDAGKAAAVWHRLYVEASLPEGAGLRVSALADDRGGEPSADDPAWAQHLFGSADGPADAPRGSWCVEPSELPFAESLSPCPPVPGRAGLFTALIQRSGVRVRRVTGRFLWLRVELTGDGQVSPEIAAIRVHGDRLSWRDRYLPAFYREQLGGADADAAGPATRHDFMDRLLGLFEGSATQLEDRIASSWLLTDPAATSAPDWLGQWIGIDEMRGEADATLREQLRAAPWTAKLHGTLGGVMAALEMATGGRLVLGGAIDPARAVPRPGQLAIAALNDAIVRTLVLGVSDPRAGLPLAVLAGGAVTRGEIVVLEGWRLRRTFATILGADLADEADPLTGSLATSGNSFVGDTLILGDDARREVLALFDADLPQSGADRAAVNAFFERLAYRVLILVRHGSDAHDPVRIAGIAEAAAPAHVETNVFSARQPLIVGAASLVGVDTFLLPESEPKAVRIGRSRIGAGDRVTGQGRLDPRADGPVSPRPRAVADGPAEVLAGRNFLLSAARSEAARGRVIARNIWTWT